MALGETNINTTLVRNSIGESTNSIGELRTSMLLNYWGFNSVQKGWGNLHPVAPYRIGDFRGYDHNFRC